jgi:hypothetical protein
MRPDAVGNLLRELRPGLEDVAGDESAAMAVDVREARNPSSFGSKMKSG